MAIIGADGNNAPEFIKGVPASIYYQIQARAYTFVNREPFSPDFGLGLVDGLSNQGLPRRVWVERLNKSLIDLGNYEVTDIQVRTVAGTVRLDIEVSPT